MRLLLSILLIGLIFPQTRSDNVVISRFSDMGFFVSYVEAKSRVSILTWILFFAVLLLHIFLLHARNEKACKD
jgi:preprotein translocase subunit SecG